ncbi:50S ribosomal protein L39e [Candidatus Woesearchaeota archaeon]|jgi:ribosomal protein L39E|nr:50S ribosomal protein L39e [Candidatus Woesearchaeota archaeon]MBT4387984.1 50S ribosomal protein L39e [Candidatus Woesearchaeota archaeon]MBT4595328.1 50S ribosomal protein L39e [Candidatus Woesearchaeota archaeon]MBT5741267.1 50S ribosomal protein L39e [Candidatus Woesearchaeota archaeon]MBT7849594.1 50S ribosomal protein L39e [Candidatus Woesearchaeota archaeon]
MSRVKSSSKKKRLAKANRLTNWAPVWTILKVFGAGQAKKTHPSQLTDRKRNWRRGRKLKV